MKKFMKALAVVFCAAILVAGSITATLAYLATKTDPVQNTFVAGDISIKLEESDTNDFTMVPGTDLEIGPTVTVIGKSEACWLFVKIDKVNNFDDYMSYEIADGWTELKDEGGNGLGVYYRNVAAANSDQPFSILKGDKATALEDCTKEDYNAILNDERPTLSFTAYAVQYANFDLGTTGHDVAAAWAIAAALS